MSETTSMNIVIDKELKEQAEAFFNDLGINMSSVFSIFVRESMQQGDALFYSPENMARLLSSIQEAEEGQFATKTLDELRTLEGLAGSEEIAQCYGHYGDK